MALQVVSAKQNVESVLNIIKDFVHFDQEMTSIRQQLANFRECDLMGIFKKIKILLFIKSRLKSQAKKDVKDFEQDHEFDEKFQSVEECY